MASDEPLDYANNAHWLLPSSSSGCSYRADGSALVSDAKSPSLTSSSGPLYSLYETSATRSVQNQHQQQQQQQQEEEDVDRGGHGSDHVAYYDAASLYPSSGEQQQQQQQQLIFYCRSFCFAFQGFFSQKQKQSKSARTHTPKKHKRFFFLFLFSLTRGGQRKREKRKRTQRSQKGGREGRKGRALEKKTKAPAPARRGWGPPFGGAPWGRFC